MNSRLHHAPVACTRSESGERQGKENSANADGNAKAEASWWRGSPSQRSCVIVPADRGRLQVVCATGVTLEVGYGPSEDFVAGGT